MSYQSAGEAQKKLVLNIFQILADGRIEDIDNLKFPSPGERRFCFKEYGECVNWDDPDDPQNMVCDQQLESCLYGDLRINFKDALLTALLAHYRHSQRAKGAL